MFPSNRDRLQGLVPGAKLYLTAQPGLQVGDRLAESDHWQRVRGQVKLSLGDAGEVVVDGPLGGSAPLLELVFETVRAQDFPERPSRLRALYLWEEEAQARAWHYRQHTIQASEGYRRAGLYEVSVVEVRRAWLADMNHASYLGKTLEEVLQRAARYWSEENDKAALEVLLEGVVEVERDLLELAPSDLHESAEMSQWLAQRALPSGDWRLERPRPEMMLLRGNIDPVGEQPMPLAGWLLLEAEDGRLLAPRPGTSPLLLEAHSGLHYPSGADETSAYQLDTGWPSGMRLRPVLHCNAQAAHYWQLQPYGTGYLRGEWLSVPD